MSATRVSSAVAELPALICLVNSNDFPFVGPNGVPVGQFPVTAGNIGSGNLAITANALDALLFGVPGASALAPGFFGLSGVFTDPQFQVVVRASNQKKGVAMLFRAARYDQERPARRD